MPTYQYACTECGYELEAVQSFSDAPLTVCTECEGRLRKVFSAVGVVFKGSGFYRTDSRAGSNGSTSPKTADVSSDSGSSKSNGKAVPSGSSSSSSSDSGSGGSSSGASTSSAPAAKSA